MEVLQWVKDHENEIGVTFARFNNQFDITMFTYKTKLCNRMTIDYYEFNEMDSKQIIDILDLMYDELSKKSNQEAN